MVEGSCAPQGRATSHPRNPEDPMLKTFRDNFQQLKWVLWAVIAVFVVFVFVDWGMGTTQMGAGQTEVAATAGRSRSPRQTSSARCGDGRLRYRQMHATGPAVEP
jgi:hypothetical protein